MKKDAVDLSFGSGEHRPAPSDPPPEVGLVRARQRRRHQGIARDSGEELLILRGIQGHRDPSCVQDLGHGMLFAIRATASSNSPT